MNAGTQPEIAYQHLIYEECGRTALISFNRPASRNAWNVPLVREVIAAVQRANASENVRAIVLTGEGPVYSAGADIKAPPEPKDANGRSPNPSTLTMGRDEYNWLGLLRQSKPVIVAVNGPAIGLGATHILSADVRVAAESATFSFPFLRLGAMPECGSTALLTRLIGFGRAMDLCLRAAQISAGEALQMGLVTAVYPDAALRKEALALAEQIAALPPLQVKLTKRLLWENAGEFDADAIMRRESLMFVEMLRTFGRAKPL
jgi:2-(1,2-epoxy-1,2-dihydrophenyl)acetyl-CoA isomerase